MPSNDLTYNVKVLASQLQQAHYVVTVACKVFESVFAMCRSCQFFEVLPRLVCRSEGNNVEGFSVLDRECQNVSVGTQLPLMVSVNSSPATFE